MLNFDNYQQFLSVLALIIVFFEDICSHLERKKFRAFSTSHVTKLFKADLNTSKKEHLPTRSRFSFGERLHYVSSYSVYGPGPTNQNLPEVSDR